MRFKFTALKRRIARFRAFVSFFFVAGAQFLSPTAAADPASKIDPPAWSHRHTREEIQAYGARAAAQEPEKNSNPVIREARLRRILNRDKDQVNICIKRNVVQYVLVMDLDHSVFNSMDRNIEHSPATSDR